VKIKPFSTTGIGSLPHRSAKDAVTLVLDTFDIPFWPQLPRLSPMEGMIAQYAEGMPFLKIDEKGIWVEREGDEALQRFYEGYNESTRLAISQDHAAGLYEFFNALRGKHLPIIKGHITGPITFTLGLNDNSQKPIYYDEELREIALMLLKGKARWQIDALRQYSDNIIIFIDEPIVSALGGTTYMGVQRQEALRLLRELSMCIEEEGAIPGAHCCGRAEWPLLIESGIRVLSFDSYGFSETLSIYPEEIKGFLGSGGYLAWGAVPTTEAVFQETEESIYERLSSSLRGLSKIVPEELVFENIILTPSCGTGSLDISGSIRVFQLLMRLKEELS